MEERRVQGREATKGKIMNIQHIQQRANWPRALEIFSKVCHYMYKYIILERLG